MKFLLIVVVIAVASAAPQEQRRIQPISHVTTTTPIPILSMESEVNGDGSYKFSYETGNGISRQESGKQKQITTEDVGATSQGAYSYTAPDGTVIRMSYVADENGFRAVGAHIPTPPPMPPHVVKLLETLRLAGKL